MSENRKACLVLHFPSHYIPCFNFHGSNSRLHNSSCFCSADLKDQKSILDGKCIQEKSFRRSPRLAFTHSEFERICRSTSPQKMFVSLAKDNLKVSLSNNSNIHSDAKPSLLSFHKGTMLFKHSKVKFIGEKHLRQSPRLNPSTRDHASVERAEQLDVKLSGRMKFRRSPRLSSSTENENLEVIVVEEKITSKAVHQMKKNAKNVSTYAELSNSPVGPHSKVKTISGNSNPRVDDTKCLRRSSEATKSPPWIEENGRTSSDSLSLTDLDDNPPRKKYKTSASLTNESMKQKSIPSFIGDPIPDDEAQKKWGWRYELKVINLILLFCFTCLLGTKGMLTIFVFHGMLFMFMSTSFI